MCPSGLQPEGQIGKPAVALEHRIVRDRLPSVRIDRHLLSVGSVAGNRRGDRPAVLLRTADHDRVVLAQCRMHGDLLRERAVRRVVLCDHQQSARVLVDAVDNARTDLAVDAGQAVPAVIHQRVDQRPAPVPRRGMHHHAARLVDHDDIRILVHHIERDVLGLNLDLSRLGQLDRNRVGFTDLVVLFERFSVLADRARFNQPLQRGARHVGKASAEHPIQTVSLLLGGNHNLLCHCSAPSFCSSSSLCSKIM